MSSTPAKPTVASAQTPAKGAAATPSKLATPGKPLVAQRLENSPKVLKESTPESRQKKMLEAERKRKEVLENKVKKAHNETDLARQRQEEAAKKPKKPSFDLAQLKPEDADL